MENDEFRRLIKELIQEAKEEEKKRKAGEKIKIGDDYLEIGDEILTGRFKNKPVVVKSFGKDKNGQPTVNGRPMLNFRIKKLMPKKKKKEK